MTLSCIVVYCQILSVIVRCYKILLDIVRYCWTMLHIFRYLQISEKGMDFSSRSRRKNMVGLLSVHQRCLHLRVNLTVEEGRSVFSRKCREAMGGGFVRGGFDSYGRPL